MIDYFCRWNSLAEAKQDAARLREHFGITVGDSPDTIKEWYLDRFIPNVQVWRISLDSPPGVHNYLNGWFGILALEGIDDAIMNEPCLQFALNRDFDPLASPKNLVVKNNIGAIISDIGVSHSFAGSHYPVGGIS